ncbi:MAG: single-stranded-DNA-specific exonuclease RecJ [Ruminococcaceae bacterium]|nr:single-stranded-DNA-specific exonuclease RecJ [Oscillospiraceae bacterium]
MRRFCALGRKVWNISTYDKNAAAALALKTGVDDLAVLLLQSRGIKTAEEVLEFVSSAEKELSSPFLLKDMEKAVNRIKEAVENGERILVYGDYDADGVTATALLTSYLEAVGADVSSRIPSRLNEGYGLSPAVAREICESGFDLVITVDNGIASFEEAQLFAENGIDFIVTDHHQAGDALPPAFAVINPHRADDSSPEENLAGVGVALKLAAALDDGDYDCVFSDLGDLAAIGTIADIVPLTGENRIIVAKGLELIGYSQRPGIIKLIENVGIKGEIGASDVAFGIAPRINAAGRIGSADTALKLLLTEDEDEAQQLVSLMSSFNTQRQNVEAGISKEIEEYFDENPSFRNDAVLVAAGKGWHPGVIGIAASRLVEKYGRPAFVISVGDDGTARGSGRSIDGFSLYEALSFCSDELIQFGGHTLAAGFSVSEEKIASFREKINFYAGTLPPFYPSLDIDIRLNPAALGTDILESIECLEPYGAENPSPMFGLFGAEIVSAKSIGGDKHMRLSFRKDKQSFSAVYFGQPLDSFPYKAGDRVDIAVKIEKNEFRGEIRPSVQIKDIRPEGEDDRKMFLSLSLYRKNLRGERLQEDERQLLCPDRSFLSQVYKFIRQEKKWCHSAEILCMRAALPYEKAGAVCVCLDALTEVGLLVNKEGAYSLSDFSGKADLRNSGILKALGYIF